MGETKINQLEKDILTEIQKKNLSPDEARKVLLNLRKPDPLKYKTKRIPFSDKKLRYLAFSDCHIGHMNYRPDVMDKMVRDAKRQGCEFAVNAGDTIEGMSGREGHIYELSHIGASAQLDAFGKEFAKFGRISKDFLVYSIEAQGSHGGWFKSKGNMGLDIGEELQRRNPKHYHFLGYDDKDLKLDNGLVMKLIHPGGGTAYAISYKLQKLINSLSGGQKPQVLHEGHFHKAIYMFYRNIHAFETGTLQEQSPFMKKQGSPAHLGYWINTITMGRKKGTVERMESQFVPFFE